MRDRTSSESGRATGRRARGELESGVMAALWAADEPLTARQLLERLPGDLAYTTVLTILSRLHDKGMLVRQPAGRGYAYAPVRDEASDTAVRMHGLLDRGSDREAVLTRFVDELSQEDEQLLHRLLGEQDAGRSDGG
ncbi:MULTISPECIES: BlaI/MecI/CopY family transcriptional regulator [Streptomyces]|uniref:BlaI/MecI/CopY family transcriptional regulator n=1 Tax=Streptomyces spinosisporus TaxID=2927582 RepID=A0ABS9XU51_9ACTN|nr:MULTISPECIES: BlaI/MecI/CopY family transcriptional regulator [Streptomyces]MCI3244866.1 BlaI/MecI/CopY family transcriptional regulator [Streptomyces spinosisporus]WUB41280.1 BlaI/MecI/CopY family transcriptional regulator [Streptomyces sp. NBC_00588]